MAAKARTAGKHEEIVLSLDADEVRILSDLAHYYEKSMGLAGRLVRLTSRARTKQRFQFIADEARSLDAFLAAARSRSETAGGQAVGIDFTPLAVVALWGRLLSSLNVPRSRRRLGREEIARREALLVKIEKVILDATAAQRRSVLDAVTTRRSREVVWMREVLDGSGRELRSTKSLQ